MEEKHPDEWRGACASIDVTAPNAKENGNNGLEEEGEPARAGQTPGNILQKARGERIDLSCVIGVPQGKRHSRNNSDRHSSEDNVTEIHPAIHLLGRRFLPRMARKIEMPRLQIR
jgi:hypothetical protein